MTIIKDMAQEKGDTEYVKFITDAQNNLVPLLKNAGTRTDIFVVSEKTALLLVQERP